MKFINIYFLIFIAILLSGCIQSTALFGPSITIATTGNVMQAGLQYGANSVIKKETGKDVVSHLKDAVDEEQKSKKIEKKFKNFVENNINKAKKKLPIN